MAGRMSAQCSQTLMERGFPADTPVVAVRAASWPDQSVECSTLGQLASAGLMTDERPVVLLIGRALASRAACQSALQSADQALRSRIGQCTLSTARVEVIA
jgi:precorrin-4 methylase